MPDSETPQSIIEELHAIFSGINQLPHTDIWEYASDHPLVEAQVHIKDAVLAVQKYVREVDRVHPVRTVEPLTGNEDEVAAPTLPTKGDLYYLKHEEKDWRVFRFDGMSSLLVHAGLPSEEIAKASISYMIDEDHLHDLSVWHLDPEQMGWTFLYKVD